MANTKTNLDGGVQKWTLDTTATGANGILVGDAAHELPGTLFFHVKVGGATPGSLKLYRALRGSGLTNTDRITPPYYNETAPSTEIAGGTDITASGIYSVVADRSSIWMDYTSGVDGMTVYVAPGKA